MEKSSFAMAKFGLEAKEAMPKRDCGFYVKYIFLFTSLIQFLIILGLVLFMVYGNAQAGTDTHLKLLEEQVQSYYRRNAALGCHQRQPHPRPQRHAQGQGEAAGAGAEGAEGAGEV